MLLFFYWTIYSAVLISAVWKYIYTYILFHYGVSQDIDYSFLFSIARPGLSMLYVIVSANPKFPVYPSLKYTIIKPILQVRELSQRKLSLSHTHLMSMWKQKLCILVFVPTVWHWAPKTLINSQEKGTSGFFGSNEVIGWAPGCLWMGVWSPGRPSHEQKLGVFNSREERRAGNNVHNWWIDHLYMKKAP